MHISRRMIPQVNIMKDFFNVVENIKKINIAQKELTSLVSLTWWIPLLFFELLQVMYLSLQKKKSYFVFFSTYLPPKKCK